MKLRLFQETPQNRNNREGAESLCVCVSQYEGETDWPAAGHAGEVKIPREPWTAPPRGEDDGPHHACISGVPRDSSRGGTDQSQSRFPVGRDDAGEFPDEICVGGSSQEAPRLDGAAWA